MKTKRAIRAFHFGVMAFHLLLLLDGLPPALLAASFVAQLSYFPLMTRFPMINLSSPMTVLAALFTLGNHFAWINHFMRTSGHSLSQLVSFYMLVIWGVPLGLLVSMSNSTQCLPNFGTMSSNPTHQYSFAIAQVHTLGKNRNIIVSLFSSVFFRHQVNHPDRSQ